MKGDMIAMNIMYVEFTDGTKVVLVKKDGDYDFKEFSNKKIKNMRGAIINM